ncbi:MAG: hypothetical protein K2L80_08010, partial [Muribaculaceae bacterium]|nr:hypothetical protein [Muribaculaceae bacterium]
IMDAFISGAEKDILTARDTTELAKVEGEKQTSIASKLNEVKEMLVNNSGKTIIVDSGKTNKKWDYSLELTLTGTTDSMNITFTDVNGEFFEGGNIHQNEIISLVREYDVFIVAVDTPFLMESRNDDSDLVSSVVNGAYNCTRSIHTFLTQINDNDGKDAKLVIFTPIKCEYWAKRNLLDNVAKAVEDDYSTTISALKKYKSVQIEILPVLTVGSAEFSEHLEALICEWSEKRFFFFNKDCRSKCGELPDGSIRVSNGEIKPRSDLKKIHEDPDAVLIPGTEIMRPNSWFRIESPEYRPHNCEQLALHILEFMLAKVVDAKITSGQNQNPLLRGLRIAANFILNVGTLGLWEKLCDLFGGISIEQMQKAMKTLNNRNLIRHSGEGIT